MFIDGWTFQWSKKRDRAFPVLNVERLILQAKQCILMFCKKNKISSFHHILLRSHWPFCMWLQFKIVFIFSLLLLSCVCKFIHLIVFIFSVVWQKFHENYYKITQKILYRKFSFNRLIWIILDLYAWNMQLHYSVHEVLKWKKKPMKHETGCCQIEHVTSIRIVLLKSIKY